MPHRFNIDLSRTQPNGEDMTPTLLSLTGLLVAGPALAAPTTSFNGTLDTAHADASGHYLIDTADVTGDGRADLHIHPTETPTSGQAKPTAASAAPYPRFREQWTWPTSMAVDTTSSGSPT